MARLKNIGLALDQLLNVLCGGWPDETLSSRAWRWHRDGVRSWPRTVIDALFFRIPDHCRRAYENELKRVQCPPEMRPEANNDL